MGFFSVTPVEPEPIEYIDFTVTRDNRHMVGYTGEENENLVIPATFVGEEGTRYKVIGIEGRSESNSYTSYPLGVFGNKIKEVVLPNTITSIGNYTFSYCASLTSVNIPNSVTSIGNSAFYNCISLTSVEIPDSVTSIGNSAFYNCISLTSVEIPDRVTSIENYAFSSCTSLISVEIPDSVKSIGDCAFSSCTSLISVEIPDSVTSIGNRAFGYCTSLTSIKYNGTTYNSVDAFKTAFNAIEGHNMA